MSGIQLAMYLSYFIVGGLIGFFLTLWPYKIRANRMEWAFGNRHEWGGVEIILFGSFWLPLFILVFCLTIKDKRAKFRGRN